MIFCVSDGLSGKGVASDLSPWAARLRLLWWWARQGHIGQYTGLSDDRYLWGVSESVSDPGCMFWYLQAIPYGPGAAQRSRHAPLRAQRLRNLG